MLHYEILPMQYRDFFSDVKNASLIRKKDMFLTFLFKTKSVGTRWNRLVEVALTSTNNLGLGSKIRKKVYPCKSVLLYKSRV